MEPQEHFDAIYQVFAGDREIDAARQLIEGAYWRDCDVTVNDVIEIGKLAGRLHELEAELHSHGWLRFDVPTAAESAVRRAYSSRVVREIVEQIHRDWAQLLA